MMNNISKNRPERFKSLPEIVAGLGIVIFIIQAIVYSQTQLPNLDESSYLFKGYQFAVGNFEPFQINGFWTNKMYLSFFIWGWIQDLFSPGLMAPRLFSIIFSSLALLGTWIITRRLGNRWIAALAVLALALNPSIIGIYSLANSQVLVLCLLTWILVLTLGANQRPWQIILGAFLSAVLVFVRENMVFVVPLLITYVFWQYGKKIGWLALGAALLTLIGGHIIYWPEITYLWARWLPNIGSLFTKGAASNAGVDLESASIFSRIHSFTVALRSFFVPIFCLFAVLVLWPRKQEWKSKAHLRAGYFLLATYVLLLASHLWASLGNDYCVYCTTTYFAFFGNLGLILFAACYSSLNQRPNLIQRIVTLITIPILVSGIWYSWFEKIGLDLVNIQVPRVSGGKILPGTTALWQLVQNKFAIDLWISRQIVPAIIGFAVGILLLFLLYLVSYKQLKSKKVNFIYFCINAVILLGLLLSPFVSSLDRSNYCSANVLRMYETVGRDLREEIPAGSRVYIEGRLSAVPLLYLPDVLFYPPQINDKYSFKTGSDSEGLVERGFWNEEFANTWRKEADYFILGEDQIKYWHDLREKLNLVEISKAAWFEGCPVSSRLHILRREND